MEKPNIETQNEELEKIKEELYTEWNVIIESLASKLNSQTMPDYEKKFNKAKAGFQKLTGRVKTEEFKHIINKYETQKRSLSQYDNLKSALQNCTSDIEKLALFYKNIEYRSSNEAQKNNEDSLAFAEPFLNFLLQRETDKTEFKKCFS